jgi:hypothetical protein
MTLPPVALARATSDAMPEPPLASERTLQDLLIIESDPQILEYRCPRTGVLLWPLIRVVMLRQIMSDLLYGTAIERLDVGHPVTGRSVTTMLRSIIQNAGPPRWPRADVCIISTAVANQREDGAWYNRLTDTFALQYPTGTLTIEEPFEWQWQEPRHHSNVRYLAPRLAIGALVGRFRVTAAHRLIASQLVTLVLSRARELLAWNCTPSRRAQLIELLARKAASLPTQYAAFDAMLDAIRPRVLLVTAGCYGPLSPLIVAANRRGVTTADYQHGAVSSGHDAYNVSPVLAADERYRESLPRFFLGYGSWWNAQINSPVTPVVIGNPHRQRQLAHIERRVPARRQLLILSDGIEFAKYQQLAQAVETAVGPLGYDVVLRPHPLERSIVRARYGEMIGAVRVDPASDLYTSLASASVVISEVSTGLFEAVGLTDRVIVWDTPKARFSYPVHPFERFTQVRELPSLLARDERGRLSAAELESIWAPGWQEKYAAFLYAAGVSSPMVQGRNGAPEL